MMLSETYQDENISGGNKSETNMTISNLSQLIIIHCLEVQPAGLARIFAAGVICPASVCLKSSSTATSRYATAFDHFVLYGLSLS